MEEQKKSGLERFRELNPEGAAHITELLADTAPSIYNWILDIAFADLAQRTNLDMKIRWTVSMVALATAYREIELRIHIKIAIALGFTKEELIEVFTQMCPFTGFAQPMLGVRLVKEIFKDV